MRLPNAIAWISMAGSFLMLAACARPHASIHPYPTDAPFQEANFGVKNFGVVTPYIWRGDQPTPRGFEHLEDRGAKSVLSLRWGHDDLDLLKGTNLKLVRLPFRAGDPGQGGKAQLALALRTLQRLSEDPRTRPVFVHCKAGRDRTGFTIAAYRMVFQGWPVEKALQEMEEFHANHIFFGTPGFLRKLDVEEMRRMVERAP